MITPPILLLACVVLWPWANWSWWPWLYGLVGLVVLRLLRSRVWIGEGGTFAVALMVVLVAMMQRVSAWGVGMLAGLVLASGCGLALARRFSWVPRRVAVVGVVVGLMLSTVSVGAAAVEAYRDQVVREGAEQIAREERMARAMPRTPQALVSAFIENIAEVDTHRVCIWRLSEKARQQFAQAHGVQYCAAAVRKMSAEIRDMHVYVNDLWLPVAIFTPPTGPQVRADACRLEWSNILSGSPSTPPGPQLGVLTLERQHGLGYQIVEYRSC